MKDKLKYTTVFPGIRDQYQMPLALHEAGRLNLFVTDFYNQGLLKSIFSCLGPKNPLLKRFRPALKDAPIQTKPFIPIETRFLKKLFQESKVAVWEDLKYSKIAYKKALKSKTSLILYEFQAEYAFQKNYPFPHKKILFQFHPNPHWEHPILLQDAASNPELLLEVQKNTRQNLPEKYKNHTCNSWVNADLILVASGITKTSLVQAGCDPHKIHIVPYGISSLDTTLGPDWIQKKPEKPFFLFVGSGTQRKGLHHLCRAWKETGLEKSHELIIISRWVESFIEKDLLNPGIRVLRGVSKESLTWHFQNAISFVLPSLSEGFGQVYLEAMANGCPIIGSTHSMLPDIKDAQEHIRYVDPLNEREITDTLKEVSRYEPEHSFFNRNSMKLSVLPYTWENFRTQIQILLDRLDHET
jgi:glycosyltransferase involved in cell wall biosynthesis